MEVNVTVGELTELYDKYGVYLDINEGKVTDVNIEK